MRFRSSEHCCAHHGVKSFFTLHRPSALRCPAGALTERQRSLSDVRDAEAGRRFEPLPVDGDGQLTEERTVGSQHDARHVWDEQVRVVEGRADELRRCQLLTGAVHCGSPVTLPSGWITHAW